MGKYVFDTPLQRGGTAVLEVDIREPKAGELRGLGLADLATGDVDSMLVLLPRITSPALTKAEAESLSLCDMGQMTGVVRGFFEPKAAAVTPTM